MKSQEVEKRSLSYNDFSVFTALARFNYSTNSFESQIGVQNFKTIMAYLLAGLLPEK
jgi:hypothetical protein